MRAALWVLGLFILAVVVTLAARFDQGYVLIVYPPWRVEMSFILAVVLAVVLFGLSYFVVRVLRLALRLPADVRAWHRRRRSDTAEDELSRAVAALLAGKTEQARQLAHSAMGREHLPLAALVAAHAALELGDREAARAAIGKVAGEVAELVAARQSIERRLAGMEPAASPAGG